MKALIIDILILVILGVSVWRGAKKGMIMTLSGLVILMLTFIFSGFFAAKVSPYVQIVIDPFFSGFAEKAATTVMRDNPADEYVDSETLKDIAASAFTELGIWDNAAKSMSDRMETAPENSSADVKLAVSDTFCASISYVLSYIIVLLIIILIVAFIASILDLAFRLPGLHMLNKIGGIALGFIYGLSVVFVAAWAIRFFGGVIGPEIIKKTILLEFFMNVNPFGAILY